jgi:hypothetical protein
MDSISKRSINEKSKIILTNQTSPTSKKGSIMSKEYSLKQHFFDPTKSSPPNEFMLKLYMRDQAYNLAHKKDDNREIQ